MASGNLRYAVLGLVASKADGVHGYQLKGECEAIADEFWALNYGRLYRILDELEGMGGDQASLSRDDKAEGCEETKNDTHNYFPMLACLVGATKTCVLGAGRKSAIVGSRVCLRGAAAATLISQHWRSTARQMWS